MPADGEPGRVDADRPTVLGEPDQQRVGLLDCRRERALRRKDVVEVHDRAPRRVGKEPAVRVVRVPVPRHEAATVQVHEHTWGAHAVARAVEHELAHRRSRRQSDALLRLRAEMGEGTRLLRLIPLRLRAERRDVVGNDAQYLLGWSHETRSCAATSRSSCPPSIRRSSMPSWCVSATGWSSTKVTS